ncbi:MAG: TIM barrel protein [Candidatus Hadarchaeales archaeon]
MIYLGPAGIPISSRDRSTVGGLNHLASLGLNAMEVEFVRGVAMSNETAEEVGKVAKKLGIVLSVHCPYFINLCSDDKKKVEASKKRILDSAERAHHMDAGIVVFHPGYYGKLSPEQAFQAVKEADEDMVDRMKAAGIKKVLLGHETTGKVSAFGTLDEIVRLCLEVKRCAPVVDFAHIYARQGGRIDYADIFRKLAPLKLDHIHSHFTSMEWSPAKVPGQGNERYHLPISHNKPPFEPLAREILKRKISITLISESPVLEQDSLQMKKIFERLGKRF